MGWTETALKSNHQNAHCYGHCVVSVSKRISKQITDSIILAKSGQKKSKTKITGSIIGPAMAGPTGPFATAL